MLPFSMGSCIAIGETKVKFTLPVSCPSIRVNIVLHQAQSCVQSNACVGMAAATTCASMQPPQPPAVPKSATRSHMVNSAAAALAASQPHVSPPHLCKVTLHPRVLTEPHHYARAIAPDQKRLVIGSLLGVEEPTQQRCRTQPPAVQQLAVTECSGDSAYTAVCRLVKICLRLEFVRMRLYACVVSVCVRRLQTNAAQ